MILFNRRQTITCLSILYLIAISYNNETISEEVLYSGKTLHESWFDYMTKCK